MKKPAARIEVDVLARFHCGHVDGFTFATVAEELNLPLHEVAAWAHGGQTVATCRPSPGGHTALYPTNPKFMKTALAKERKEINEEKALALQQEKQFAVLGEQLTEQYDKATSGMLEFVKFGAMVETVQKIVSTCGHDRSQGGGRDTKGEGLKGWLEKHAPKIPRQRAYDYLKIAQNIREKFALPAKTDLAQLLDADPKKLDPKQRKKQTEIMDAIEGKSRRQLLLFGEVGVPDGDKKPTGGKREKPAKPQTAEEQAEAAAKTARALLGDTVLAVNNFTSGLHHTHVTKDERLQLVNLFRTAIDKLNNVGE